MEKLHFNVSEFFDFSLESYFKSTFSILLNPKTKQDITFIEEKHSELSKKLIKYFQKCQAFIASQYPSGIRTLIQTLNKHLYIDIKTIPKRESEQAAAEYDRSAFSIKELCLTELSRVTVYKIQLVVRLILIDLWYACLAHLKHENEENKEEKEILENCKNLAKEIVKVIDFVRIKMNSVEDWSFDEYFTPLVKKFAKRSQNLEFLQALGNIVKKCEVSEVALEIVKNKFKEVKNLINEKKKHEMKEEVIVKKMEDKSVQYETQRLPKDNFPLLSNLLTQPNSTRVSANNNEMKKEKSLERVPSKSLSNSSKQASSDKLNFSLTNFLNREIFEKNSQSQDRELSERSDLMQSPRTQNSGDLNKSFSSTLDDLRRSNPLKRNNSRLSEPLYMTSLTSSKSSITNINLSKEEMPISLTALNNSTKNRTYRSLYSSFNKTAHIDKKSKKTSSQPYNTVKPLTPANRSNSLANPNFAKELQKKLSMVIKEEVHDQEEQKKKEVRKVLNTNKMEPIVHVAPSLDDWTQNDVLVVGTPVKELSEASKGFSSNSSGRRLDFDENSIPLPKSK